LSRVEAFRFEGPAGALEGLWKPGDPPRRGSAVFAHPHPLHGGTLHNKVVFRAAKALTAAGYDTLRFNFRGAGASEGRHDRGQGEKEDFRAAVDEAVRRGGTPVVAGGFSFGSAVALSAIAGDPRVAAFLGLGLPVATYAGRSWGLPAVPAIFLVGEHDVYGPPEKLRRALGPAARIVVVAGADHFFEGHLDEVERALAAFLAELPVEALR
jgi:alpha/beta superfamily hydrolase